MLSENSIVGSVANNISLELDSLRAQLSESEKVASGASQDLSALKHRYDSLLESQSNQVSSLVKSLRNELLEEKQNSKDIASHYERRVTLLLEKNKNLKSQMHTIKCARRTDEEDHVIDATPILP